MLKIGTTAGLLVAVGLLLVVTTRLA